MKTERLKIHLMAAPDEVPVESAEYQKELRELRESLRSHGLRPSFELDHIYAAAHESSAVYSGAFMVALASLPIVSRCVIAWIKGRFGRKVRLEVWPDGRAKGEGKTAEEVAALFQTAEEYQKNVAKKTPKKKVKKIERPAK